MRESEIQATVAPRPVPSETRDAARARETTSEGATPSVPGKKVKMFITLWPSQLIPVP